MVLVLARVAGMKSLLGQAMGFEIRQNGCASLWSCPGSRCLAPIPGRVSPGSIVNGSLSPFKMARCRS